MDYKSLKERMAKKAYDIANKANEKINQAADALAQKVEENGGLGQIVENATVYVGEKAGTVAGHVAKAVDGANNYVGDDLNLKNMYNNGRVDVQATSQKGKELAQGLVTRTKSAAQTLTTIVQDTKSTTRNVKEGVKNFVDDIAEERDHYVHIGNEAYHVDANFRSDITNVKSYMLDLAEKIPQDAAGRSQLLTFVAKYAITDTASLHTQWKRKNMPETNATHYL